MIAALRASGDAWAALEAELECWLRAGMTASLWWRDDDAVAPSAALDRLIAVAAEIPLALAVIPAEAGEALARRLETESDLSVLQHGYAHANHRPPAARASEFGGDRPRETELDEIARGAAHLQALFEERFLPVFVPPWNRIDDSLAPGLAALGHVGLSCFGARPAASRHGLSLVNTHLDPIAWRRGRGFVGEEEAIRRLIEELAPRRNGAREAAEPLGLLTHHRVHPPELWRFLERLANRLRTHPAIVWRTPAEMFRGQANSGHR